MRVVGAKLLQVGKMGENGTYCENLQIFCGKMGLTLRRNPKKTLFPGPGGLWGGVLSHMS